MAAILLFVTGTALAQTDAPAAQSQTQPQTQSQTQPVRIFNDPSSPQTAPPNAVAPKPEVDPSKTSTTGKAHSAVEAIKLAAPTAATLAARKDAYKLTISGDDWTDTHIVLATPDRVQFTATGTVTLADGRNVPPDGSQRGWKDLLRQFPANGAPAGALIGRIGTDAAVTPFAIGASKTLDVTTAGELYLRVNTSSDLSPQGAFDVSLKLSKEPKPATTAVAAPELNTLITPALFDNIPRRVQDQQNDPGDMVNFSIIGTQDQVEKAFANAGWVRVDKTTSDAVVHGLLATLSHEAYTEMPMSTLFLFGRSQDLSYARADPLSVAAVRHHLRIWKSTETVGGKPLWVGSATHDNGFEKDQRNGGVTHHIDPNIDKERDFIEQSFAAAGNLAGAAYVTPAHPLQTAKTATGGTFQSDGRIVVLNLH